MPKQELCRKQLKRREPKHRCIRSTKDLQIFSFDRARIAAYGPSHDLCNPGQQASSGIIFNSKGNTNPNTANNKCLLSAQNVLLLASVEELEASMATMATSGNNTQLCDPTVLELSSIIRIALLASLELLLDLACVAINRRLSTLFRGRDLLFLTCDEIAPQW